MSQALLVPVMSKKAPRDDQAVKVDRQIVLKAQLIAKSLGMTTAEYVSEVLRPHVEKDLPKAMAKLGLQKD